MAGAFFGVGDVDGGLEFGADRDSAGGQVQDEAEQKARVEVGGQVAGFLGLGDRLDLSAGEGDAGRVGLAPPGTRSFSWSSRATAGWPAEGERVPISAGWGVRWAAGETHSSGTEAGLIALAVEGSPLDLFEPESREPS